jgi:predicted transcriptional regulator
MSTLTQTPAQTISTRFTADTLARLDELSQVQNRSRSDIVKEAVDGYLDAMVWFEAQVKQGIDDLKNGHRISHEDLKAKYRKLGVDVD